MKAEVIKAFYDADNDVALNKGDVFTTSGGQAELFLLKMGYIRELKESKPAAKKPAKKKEGK